MQGSNLSSERESERRCDELAKQLGDALKRCHGYCAVAESCTGGTLAATLTDCPGSSAWFDRGFVTYSNQAKQDLLGVSLKTLQTYGAVSEETVFEMVEGALKNSTAQLAVAISGIAGPDGGSIQKPVGTVWIAWAVSTPSQVKTQAQVFLFQGNRSTVRQQAVYEALVGMLHLLKTTHSNCV